MKLKIKCFIYYDVFFAITILIFIMSSCEQHPEVSDELVAQDNDSYLLINQLNYLVPDNIDPELALALKKNIISKWVDNEILYQAALDDGITLDDKENFLLEKYHKSFRRKTASHQSNTLILHARKAGPLNLS